MVRDDECRCRYPNLRGRALKYHLKVKNCWHSFHKRHIRPWIRNLYIKINYRYCNYLYDYSQRYHLISTVNTHSPCDKASLHLQTYFHYLRPYYSRLHLRFRLPNSGTPPHYRIHYLTVNRPTRGKADSKRHHRSLIVIEDSQLSRVECSTAVKLKIDLQHFSS